MNEQARKSPLPAEHGKEESTVPDAIDLPAILDALPGFVYQLRMDATGLFRYTYLGRAVEEMFGVDADRVYADARILLDLIHADDYPRVLASSLECALHMRPWHCEFRMQLPDGRQIWLETHATPIRMRDGTLAWNGYGQDITGRRQLQQALADSEWRFRSFVENLDDIIYTIDAAGVMTYVSPNLQEKTGFQPDELQGQSFTEFVHPEDVPVCERFLEDVLNGTVKKSGLEFRLRHKDGSWNWSSTTLSPVLDAHSQCLYGLGLTHDISKRKEQDELMRFQAHHDSLTGLPNRAFLFQKIEECLCRLAAGNQSLVLMFLDLDHFKPVNDTHGHDTGDILLQRVAARISGVLRTSDLVSRIGGDEFIILLPAVSCLDDALSVAAKIQETLAAPFDLHGENLSIGCSIGIAMAPEHASAGDALARRADEAMYRAKRLGRNRIEVWQA